MRVRYKRKIHVNYVLGLKGNQGTLQDDVKLLFKNKPKKMRFTSNETIEKGHGRIEKRICTVTEDIDWLREAHPHWKELHSIVEIESTRDIKGKISVEKRYYM